MSLYKISTLVAVHLTPYVVMPQTHPTTSRFTKLSEFSMRWRVSGSCHGTGVTRTSYSSGQWNSRKGTSHCKND